MILVKNWQFFHLFNIGIPLFFLGNIGEENVFYNILERKKPFSAIKTRFSKRRKMKIFPKGLIHGFGPKTGLFSIFSF